MNNLTPANDEIMSSTPNLGGGAVGPVRPRRPDTRLIGVAKVIKLKKSFYYYLLILLALSKNAVRFNIRNEFGGINRYPASYRS